MRELCWSLWKQRWVFLVFAVTGVLFAGTIYQITGGYGLFELCYRTAFVLLQLIFMLLQRERFHIVLRKERAHRFYRSMPYAWEKEQKRFVRLDVFCIGILAVLLAVGMISRNEFVDVKIPFALVVLFLTVAMEWDMLPVIVVAFLATLCGAYVVLRIQDCNHRIHNQSN